MSFGGCWGSVRAFQCSWVIFWEFFSGGNIFAAADPTLAFPHPSPSAFWGHQLFPKSLLLLYPSHLEQQEARSWWCLLRWVRLNSRKENPWEKSRFFPKKPRAALPGAQTLLSGIWEESSTPFQKFLWSFCCKIKEGKG